MKVNGRKGAQTDLEQIKLKEQLQQRQAQQAKRSGPNSGVEDSVNVGLAKDIAGYGTARQERLEEIRRLLELGEYNVSSKEIAGSVDSIISEEVRYNKIQNS